MAIFLGMAAIWNLYAFCIFGWDKRQARLHRRRTPERSLYLLALTGGAPGAIAGILFFRHKTRKGTFLLRFIPAAILGCALLLAILCGLRKIA
jgi:uncharacterized membrane protein YsdA (DUF1294 family)